MRPPQLLLWCLLVAGCASEGPPAVQPDVDLYSPSGTRRSQAVQMVATSGDTSYVPELIAMLDDRDETVRLQAHAALKEMTGHDTGYRPYEGQIERAEHVRAWQAWWASQQDATVSEGGVGE